MSEQRPGPTPQQLEAIEAPAVGSIKIVAGAGTGKTEVLTRRVMTLVQRGIPPGGLVAITYTKKAAAELKQRLVGRLGLPPARLRELSIATFHSFLLERLRRDPFTAGLDRDTRVLAENTRGLILARVLARFSETHADALIATDGDGLGPDVAGRIVAALPRLLAQVRRYLLDPAACFREAEAHFAARDVAPGALPRRVLNWFFRFATEYLQELGRLNALDFDGILVRGQALVAAEGGTMARPRCFLIDEFQDNNCEQFGLIARFLEAPGAHLTVVGDPAQSIYRFMGADLATFTGFAADTEKSLTLNFRSVQEILALADAVIEPQLPFPRRLEAARGPSMRPRPIACLTVPVDVPRPREVEGEALVAMIDRLVNGGGRYRWRDRPLRFGDIAIVVSSLRHVGKDVEDGLIRRGIPYVMSGGMGFYDRAETREILAVLRLLENPADDFSLLQLLTGPLFGLADSDLAVLARHGRVGDEPLLTGLLAAPEPDLSPPARRFRRMYLQLLAEKNGRSVLELTYRLLDLAGFRAYAAGITAKLRRRRRENNVAKFLAMVRHFEASQLFTSLKDFLIYVDTVLDAGIDEEEAGLGDDLRSSDAVKIMTIHKAKGLEFPVVFMPFLKMHPWRRSGLLIFDRAHGLLVNCDEQGKPCPDAPGLAEHFAREQAADSAELWRRLYVGLTRAEEMLLVSGSARELEGDADTPLRRVATLLGDNPAWGRVEPMPHWPEVLRDWGCDIQSMIDSGSAPPPVDAPAPVAAAASENTQVDQPDLVVEPGEATARLSDGMAALARVHGELRELGVGAATPGALPRGPSFSLADLLRYEDCPRRYYLNQQHVTPFAEAGSAPAGIDVGSFVHHVLRLYHETPAAGVDEWQRRERMAAIVDRLEPLTDPSGVARAQAWPILLAYLRHPWSQTDPWLVEAEVNLRMGREPLTFWLRGFADRVDRSDDGVRIVDYKTGRPGTARHRRYARQMALYVIAASRGVLGDGPQGGQRLLTYPTASILYLGADRAVDWPIEPDQAGLELWAEGLVARLRAESTWAPAPGERCAKCGYNVLCGPVLSPVSTSPVTEPAPVADMPTFADGVPLPPDEFIEEDVDAIVFDPTW